MNEEVITRCKVEIPGTEAYRNEIEPALVGIVSALIDEGWRMCPKNTVDAYGEEGIGISFLRGPLSSNEYASVDVTSHRFDAPRHGKPWFAILVEVRFHHEGTSVRTGLQAKVSYDLDENPMDIYDAIADHLVPAMERMIHAIRGTCEYM